MQRVKVYKIHENVTQKQYNWQNRNLYEYLFILQLHVSILMNRKCYVNIEIGLPTEQSDPGFLFGLIAPRFGLSINSLQTITANRPVT